MHIKLKIIILLTIIATAVVLLITKNTTEPNNHLITQGSEIIPDREVIIEITPNSTYGELMKQTSTTPETANAIFEASEDIYNLSKIRAGRELKLIYDKDTDKFKKLVYQIDTEKELYVKLENNEWKAEKKQIKYEIKIKTSDGVIESSMYETALEKGIDEVAIIQLSEVFQWTVDFAMEVQKGDYFKLIYEERYRDGEYMMPGEILAAKFVNEEIEHFAYFFKDPERNEEHYDQNGNSVQKIFLRAPVHYKYISSGFTTGLRYIKAFDISTGHRAIDYAAPTGTPVRAVGEGKIVYRGWKGSYGYSLSVRHNSVYTTNYCHLSSFAVKYGQEVKQGQTIGYVGSTGLSTGPHLHYEMVKHGTKINPLKEELPPGKAIKEEYMEGFKRTVEKYKNKL